MLCSCTLIYFMCKLMHCIGARGRRRVLILSVLKILIVFFGAFVVALRAYLFFLQCGWTLCSRSDGCGGWCQCIQIGELGLLMGLGSYMYKVAVCIWNTYFHKGCSNIPYIAHLLNAHIIYSRPAIFYIRQQIIIYTLILNLIK